jgi:hypothetical protein
VCTELRNLKSGQNPEGCRAIEKEKRKSRSRFRYQGDVTKISLTLQRMCIVLALVFYSVIWGKFVSFELTLAQHRERE